jgi:hypothetical protein
MHLLPSLRTLFNPVDVSSNQEKIHPDVFVITTPAAAEIHPAAGELESLPAIGRFPKGRVNRNAVSANNPGMSFSFPPDE